MPYCARISVCLRSHLFLLGFFCLAPLAAQPVDRDHSSASQGKIVCMSSGNELCINATDDFLMTLLGCTTGFEDFFGFPPFEINVPPGEDFKFALSAHPASILRSFFIISKALDDMPGSFDLCNQTDPGIFVGPEFIEFNNPSPLTEITVPSAVVDQMVAASNADGFVIMISRDCNSNIENFAGVKFTRNPTSQASLNLAFQSPPTITRIGNDTQFSFKLLNGGTEALEDIAFQLSNLNGGLDVRQLSIDGMPCMLNTATCTFSIQPNESKVITATVRFENWGGNFLAGDILSDRCEARVQVTHRVFVSPISGRRRLTNFGRRRARRSNRVSLFNPNNTPVVADFSATDALGDSCTKCIGDFRISGEIGTPDSPQVTLQPGETKTINIPEKIDGDELFTFQVVSDLPLQGQILQEDRIDLPEVLVQTCTRPLMEVGEEPSIETEGLIPMKIQDPSAITLVLRNSGEFPRKDIVINVFDLETRMTKYSIGEIELGPYEVKIFHLDETDVCTNISFLAWDNITLSLERDYDTTTQIIPAETQPTETLAIPAIEARGSVNMRQPFFLPDPMEGRNGPSTNDLFLFSESLQQLPAGVADFSFDENCGLDLERIFSLPFTPEAGSVAMSINIPGQNQMIGGFGQVDTPNTITSVLWQEGPQPYWLLAEPSVTQGRLFIPQTTPFGDPNPQIAEIKFQSYSDSDLILAVAAYNSRGDLLRLLSLELPSGGHLFCNEDLGLSNEVAYIEFQIPEDHADEFWFHALADVPEISYKDQLPILAATGTTRLSIIGDVIGAWSGGPSCLGEMPDMTALVAFVNNGFMCPTP